MDHRPVVRRLAALEFPTPTAVTLALDLSESGILPPATRVFVQSQVLPRLTAGRRGGSEREIADRLTRFLDSELRPETHGLFLVAGPGLWEPLELGVPLENFVHVGRQPYLGPLLDAEARWPRVYVYRASDEEGLIQETHLGRWIDLDRIACEGMEWIDQNAERILTSRAPLSRVGSRRVGSGIGGGKRDRFRQTLEEAAGAAVAEGARRVAALHARSPAPLVLFFGDRERFAGFRENLPRALRGLARFAGPLSRRDEDRLRRSVREEIAALAYDRHQAETLEFHERRAQGHHVARGPADVLAHLESGKLARVFLDAHDPVSGTKCAACGHRQAGGNAACDLCGGAPLSVSLAQEVVARSVSHPPLPITFVRKPAGWLAALGGMAGLLSTKGIRGRRVHA